MKPVLSCRVCAVLAILAAAIPATAAEGFRWESDLATAQRMARQSNRLVLIHFGGPWCGPCQMLERNVFSQQGFGRELATDYVAVKIDPRSSDEAKAIARQYGIERVPFDVVTTSGGQLVLRIQSPSTAAGYVSTLANVARQVQPDRQNTPPAAAPASNPPPQVAGQGPSQTPTRPADNRYADYYNRRQPTEREPYQPPVQHQAPPPASQPPAPAQPGVQTASASADRYADRYADRAADRSVDRSAEPPQREPKQEPPAEEQLASGESSLEAKIPPGNPPLALDGYCPVTLIEQKAWQEGDPKIGAIHRQRTYLFANQAAQQKFLANPDAYSPVCRGHDPVLVLDQNQAVPGRREFGVFYGDRIYLFANEATLQQFAQNPKRYSAEIMQAMRQ